MIESKRQDNNSFLAGIQLKIVYWGPGESGKTTNYLRLMKKYSDKKIAKGFCISTTDRRTLWQDSGFLMFNSGFSQIIIQITTCTGQERFLSSREHVLGGADGIIFVGDSSPEKMDQNLRSFKELLSFTRGLSIPFLIQLNKRDIPGAISIEDFKDIMGLPEESADEYGHLIVYPAIAIRKADTVFQIFQDLIEKILYNQYKNRINNKRAY